MRANLVIILGKNFQPRKNVYRHVGYSGYLRWPVFKCDLHVSLRVAQPAVLQCLVCCLPRQSPSFEWLNIQTMRSHLNSLMR